jgi:endoglucanase
MTAIRLPLAWERLQPALFKPLAASELGLLDAVLDEAARDRLSVVLDLHGFGSYRGQDVGSEAVPDSAFADMWRRLALHAHGRPGAVFGLMNEPHTMPPARWRVSAEAALRAIRATGARNLVLVSGANWDGAHSWTAGGAGSNAAAMDGLIDRTGPVAFEFHQYFDSDASGTHTDCLSPQAAVAALEPATEWLEHGRQQGFLGEFGVTGSPACLATLDAVLGFLDRHRASWIGWTYWAAGPWWGDYMFSAEPTNGQDKPQVAVLERHLPRR